VVDERCMELSRHIYKHTCDTCGAPALTFNEIGDALCQQHATRFIRMPDVETQGDDHSFSDQAQACI